MKFYIASGFENAKIVKSVATVLKAYGMSHTFDWTKYENVKDADDSTIYKIAECGLQGVKEADILVVLLPGGRGTHVELGIANCTGKKVFLWAESEELFLLDGAVCPFYLNSNVERIVGDRFNLIERIFRYEEEQRKGH